jgi:hypothetical protein
MTFVQLSDPGASREPGHHVQGPAVISPELRLQLMDMAIDRLDDPLSYAGLGLFVRHLRRSDLDPTQWHRCADLADSGVCSHHQARAYASQLVEAGLLERKWVARRVRGNDGRYTAYRLVMPVQEGATR